MLANTQMDMQQDLRIVLRTKVEMSDNFEKLIVQVTEGFAKLAEARSAPKRASGALTSAWTRSS